MNANRLLCRDVAGLLAEYLEHELPEIEATRVRAHLDRCPVCRADAQRMSRALGALHDLRRSEMPDSVRTGLYARIAAMERRRPAPVLRFRYAGAAAALLIAVSSAAFLAGRRDADRQQAVQRAGTGSRVVRAAASPIVSASADAVSTAYRSASPSAPAIGVSPIPKPSVTVKNRRSSGSRTMARTPVPDSILDVADKRGVTARMLLNARAGSVDESSRDVRQAAMALPAALGEPAGGEWRDRIRIGDSVTELRGMAQRDESGRLRAIRVSATTANSRQADTDDETAATSPPSSFSGTAAPGSDYEEER